MKMRVMYFGIYSEPPTHSIDMVISVPLESGKTNGQVHNELWTELNVLRHWFPSYVEFEQARREAIQAVFAHRPAIEPFIPRLTELIVSSNRTLNLYACFRVRLQYYVRTRVA